MCLGRKSWVSICPPLRSGFWEKTLATGLWAGGLCPTALPGGHPGPFMLPMPHSVSVNTMCFFFHAGFGALLFSTFCSGLNVREELRLWLLKSPRLSTSGRLGLAPTTWGQPGLGSDKLLSKNILCSWEHLLSADILGRPHFSGNCGFSNSWHDKKQKTLHKNKFRRKTLVGHTFNISLIGDPNLNSTAPQDPQCLPYALDMGHSTSF